MAQRDDFSVLVFDMARPGEPDGERMVHGFATAADARAYAEARVRSSVEELRARNVAADELRRLWHLFGEDCRVLGDSESLRGALDLYIAVPATPAECDWAAMTPWLRRYHTRLLIGNGAGHSAWAGGYLNRYIRPSRATLLAIFRADARAGLERQGLPDIEPSEVHVGSLFELGDAPLPPAGDTRPLLRWRVEVSFVCHDVKFGASQQGIFEWPQEPAGASLDTMTRVLIGDCLALRGDGPDYVAYCDVLGQSVAPSNAPVDHPARPVETPIPD